MNDPTDVSNVESALDEALRHHMAGRVATAAPVYRQVLAVAPEHTRALHLLGIAEHQGGRHEAAIELMQRALRQSPERADILNDLAQACIAANRFDEAIDACRRAVALRPDYVDPRLCLGALLCEKECYEEAVAEYRRAVALAPDLPDAHFGLANALARSERGDEAVAGYEKAVALAPDMLGARMNFGHLLEARQDFAGAADQFRRAAALAPEDANILLKLGDALVSAGELEEALGCYERAVTLDAPRDALFAGFQAVGYRLRSAGRLELAARAFAHALPNRAHDRESAMRAHADRMTHALPMRSDADILRIAVTEGLVSAGEIERLAGVAATFRLVGGSIETGRAMDQSIRRSDIRWLERTPDTHWIYARVMERIQQLNDAYWRFDLNVMSDDIQYGEYGPGGHYSWHLDLGHGHLSNRKLSFSVQLSDPREYDGGELELKIADATIVAPRSQGTLIVFPSFLMHRVAPVTRGVRRSLVGWISGTHPYR